MKMADANLKKKLNFFNRNDWKCGKCGKEYTFNEFISLMKTKLIESDTDPIGYTPVCECGYRFSLDKWRLQDKIIINTDRGDVDIIVSTVFLELNHSWIGKNIWYETMIFSGGFDDDKKKKAEWLKCYLTHRYETMKEAVEDHNKIVDLLKKGKYKIENYQWNKDNEDKKELILEG